MSENNRLRPTCVNCQYYYVTWDKKFPKGCKLYGFKSSNPPDITVRKATGQTCDGFSSKYKKK